MLSSDRNIEQISQLILELKHYTELRIESFETDLVSKLTRLLTAIAVSAVVFMLLTLIVIFASVMTAIWLAPYVGGEAAGYAVVAAFYLLLTLIFYLKRHTWVENPIANYLGHLFLDRTSKKTEKNEDK